MSSWTLTAETPLGDCGDWLIRATCYRCQRVGTYRLADAAGLYGGRWTVGEFAARLRCGSCGERPGDVTVMSTDDPVGAMRSIRIVVDRD
jgi:hypothetical protein